MKKIIFILLLLVTTSVAAKRTYLLKNEIDGFITQNDNYNYSNYIIKNNEILVVSIEDGILANDVITDYEYKIVLLEYSENSNIEDIELNETTGAFSFSPSDGVLGDVIFKYYIEYNGIQTNVSYINFFVGDKEDKENIPNTGI